MARRDRAKHAAATASLYELETIIYFFDLNLETRWWHRVTIRGLRRDVIDALSSSRRRW